MATINGNNRSNRLTGTFDGDLITGLGGSDRLFGGAGDDILYGDDQVLAESFGFGDDILAGGDGRDVLVGGAGDDRLSGEAGDDVLFNAFAAQVQNQGPLFGYAYSEFGDGGNDALDGGEGFDSAIVLLDRGAGVTIDITDPTRAFRILAGEAVIGSIVRVERLQFYGGGGVDRVTGGASYDELVGRGGDDRLTGADGADRLDGGAGNDLLDGGEGFDVASYASASAGVRVDLGLEGVAQDTRGAGVDILIGIEQVDGSGFDDRLFGGANNDYMTGGLGGNDVLNGRDGDDSLNVYRFASDRPTRSIASGGAGNDSATMSAAVGAQDELRFVGGSGNDMLFIIADGVHNHDLGSGEDTLALTLSRGTATVALGKGVDTILFQNALFSPSEPAAVTISDFRAGNNGDRIDIRTWLDQAAPDYTPGANPFRGGFLRLEQVGTDTALLFDRDGAGGDDAVLTLLVMQDTVVADFSAFNFGGQSPFVVPPAAFEFV